MPPKKERGPGPLVNGAEAETLVSVAEENWALPSYRASRPVSQLAAWRRLDEAAAAGGIMSARHYRTARAR